HERVVARPAQHQVVAGAGDQGHPEPDEVRVRGDDHRVVAAAAADGHRRVGRVHEGRVVAVAQLDVHALDVGKLQRPGEQARQIRPREGDRCRTAGRVVDRRDVVAGAAPEDDLAGEAGVVHHALVADDDVAAARAVVHVQVGAREGARDVGGALVRAGVHLQFADVGGRVRDRGRGEAGDRGRGNDHDAGRVDVPRVVHEQVGGGVAVPDDDVAADVPHAAVADGDHVVAVGF